MEPQIPVIPTSPPQPAVLSVSPIFPKKSNFAVILLSILLIIALFVSGYLFLRVQNLTKQLAQLQVQPTPTPLSTQIPSPTTDPTADWKTYTNTKYKFELKYPTNLPDFKTKIIGTSDKPFYVIRESFSSENFGTDYGIEIAIWDNPSKSTLKTWLESMKDAQALDFPALLIEDSDLTSNYTVDGKEALKFWSDLASKGQEPGNCEQACPMNEVYVAHENKVFRILFGFSREVNNDDLKTLDQILSTFKFTD